MTHHHSPQTSSPNSFPAYPTWMRSSGATSFTCSKPLETIANAPRKFSASIARRFTAWRRDSRLSSLTCSCVAVAVLLFVAVAGHAQTRCSPSPPMPKNPKPGVIGLTLSRDGKTLLTGGGDGVIRVWDLASGELKRTFTGHTNSIYKAEFSPNEKLIASSSRDSTARIWDFATGRELHKLTGFHCAVKAAAFSPNGKTVADVGNDAMLKFVD